MKPIITKIDDNWIREHHPCEDAIEWWNKTEQNPIKILELLIKEKRYNWANWFIVRVMSYKDYVCYAIYAAEQIIDIFEKKYPNDKRPRQAIEATKKCVRDPSEKNKRKAAEAAGAAWAAAWAAAEAAWAATEAAGAAAEAAEAAGAAAGAAGAAAGAAWAAWAAAEAAEAAGAAAEAAEAAMRLKILRYGMNLIKRR